MTIKYQTLRQYITNSDKLTSKKTKGLVDKSDISNLVKYFVLNTKLAILASKAELKAEQDKIVKLQVFDSSFFRGKIHLKIMTCKII